MLYDVYTTFIYILQWLEHCICRPSASALLKHRSDQISEVHSSSRASGILCSDNFLASLTQLPGPRKLFDVWRICYSVDQRTIPHYSLQRPAHLGFAHAWRICGLQGCQTNKSRWIDIRWYKSIQLMSQETWLSVCCLHGHIASVVCHGSNMLDPESSETSSTRVYGHPRPTSAPPMMWCCKSSGTKGCLPCRTAGIGMQFNDGTPL